MGTTQFRIPPALSSILAALGTIQPRAVRILNRVVPLVSLPNYYKYVTKVTIQLATNLTIAANIIVNMISYGKKLSQGIPIIRKALARAPLKIECGKCTVGRLALGTVYTVKCLWV